MKSAYFFIICLSSVSTENWTNYLKLDSNYEIFWSIEGERITFQVEVATRGWIGFGITPNGGMAGSDVIIAWINDGTLIFHDRFAEGNFQPKIDEQQDWEVLWSQENDTHTSLRFRRPLNTGDDEDICINPSETIKLIYAYHPDDPSSDTSVTYHGTKTRGSRSILLTKLEEIQYSNETSKDIHHWEIRSANVVLPNDKASQYFCTLIRRPNLKRKHHIIEISPLIQPGNKRFVHHMLLYECYVDEEKLLPYLDKRYHECIDENNLPKFKYCLTPTIGWGVGGGAMLFPDEAGIPIGLPDLVWYLLEVHYDNPGLEKGVVDNSGLLITYTPKLRKYDSSSLTVGTLTYPCIFVPPKQREFTVAGHAHPSCLKQRFPKEGIKVFSSLLHSHIIGKRIILRHFRGNVELPPLSRDRHYDFNYQEYRFLSEPRIVLPTDHLILECTYDSSRRSVPTYGGFKTTEEMCLAVLGYYPKIDLAATFSCPFPTNILKLMGVKQISDDERSVISPITGKNLSYYDFLDSYPWEDDTVNRVETAMKHSPHLNFCADRRGKGITNAILSRYPEIKHTYREQDICSVSSQQRKPITEESIRIKPARRMQNRFPPEVRTSTKKPRREYPPTIPEISNIRPTRNSFDTIVNVTDIPHVIPYPLIDQAFQEFD